MKSYHIRSIIAALLVAGSLPSRGQHAAKIPPYTMRISAISGVAGKEFQIAITRTARQVHLWYGSLDSVRMKPFRADPDFYESNTTRLDPDAERARLLRFGAAIQKYKVFTQDSMQVGVASHHSLVQLLDSVYMAAPELLEQKEANRGRVVLDGTLVYVVMKSGGKVTQQIGAVSPQPGTHPLLYRLVHESLQAYRVGHFDSFLTSRLTNGY
jgi:hypothetical protein